MLGYIVIAIAMTMMSFCLHANIYNFYASPTSRLLTTGTDRLVVRALTLRIG